MIKSANINNLKCGDLIEADFGGMILRGTFIRFHEGDIRFLVLGSVVTTKPGKVTYINEVPIVQEEGK